MAHVGDVRFNDDKTTLKKDREREKMAQIRLLAGFFFLFLTSAAFCEMSLRPRPRRSPPSHCLGGALGTGFSYVIFEGKGKSDAQFVGLRQHHLEDGHEGRRLAEVAVADDVGVDVEALGVRSALDAPGYVVESSDNGGGELQSATAGGC